ncbi:MAG: lipid A deacylase LpxR family protein [Ferruginibacter sp.]|nr:lipid A deacylase LpxR family protein [Ferruginibacter sp.]
MKKGIFYILFLITVFVFSQTISAQVIDNSSTFKTLPAKSDFRFQYDNDFFTHADRYYSQGLSFEFVHPGLKKNPLTKLLIKPANSNISYGIGLNVFGYTPTSILSVNILYSDRPYAAALTIKTFSAATDSILNRRISSAFNIGVIGPAALGDEIQTNIHKWLKNPLPKGWHTQIQNDLILNYQVNYEQKLIASTGHFLLNGAGELRLGTLDTRLSGGLNFMAGNFNDPYAGVSGLKKQVEYFFYAQARGHLVGYDASLQGGIFNRHDPYIISSNDVERLSFQADAGIVVNLKKIYLSYSQSFIITEFKSGKNHRWGGFSVGFAL